MAKHRPEQIRNAICHHVFWDEASPVAAVASEFSVTRQAAQKHLQRLVDEGAVRPFGRSPHRRYRLTPLRRTKLTLTLNSPGTEDEAWARAGIPLAYRMSADERDIWHYGLTEMVNNAIDHSEGRELLVRAFRTAASVHLEVADDGIGIFKKLAAAVNVKEERQSILELTKGKFTTDPKRHTGEGIFFTSRAFDRFQIESGELQFSRTTNGAPLLSEIPGRLCTGTRVLLDLLLPSSRTLREVFSRHSSGPDEYRFSKTQIPLKLLAPGGDSLISRSEAKRALARIGSFDQVVLDFTGIRTVGQAFADEVFRVFAGANPGIRLIPQNANEQITGMIRRAMSLKPI